MKYGPRVDNDFLPKDPETLVKEVPKKPTIIGITEMEAILFSSLDYLNYTAKLLFADNFLSFETVL